MEASNQDGSLVYVGTYEVDDKDSIYCYQLNGQNGELTFLKSFQAGNRPSYIATDKQRQYLYAVNEEVEDGTVRSFKIDLSNHTFTFINKQPCKGDPCHLDFDPEGKFLLTASYTSGSINAYAVKDDGSVEGIAENQHHGSSVNKDRQTGPHAHYITVDPTKQFILVVDLGKDQILRYPLLSLTKDSKFEDPQVAYSSTPGVGPRHLVFSPSGKFAYVLNELVSTIDVVSYDGSSGTFSHIETVNSVPGDFNGDKWSAAIRVSEDGKTLYCSNRNHNSIAVFNIDQDTGRLNLVQHASTGGSTPRDFNIDPTGKFLLVANQDSDNVIVFEIEKETGKLQKLQQEVQVPKPVCIHLYKVPK